MHVSFSRALWGAQWRIVGVWPVALSLAALLVLLASNAIDLGIALPMFEPARVIETVVPLALGFQAAFAFSPADEPPLEILLAMPRRVYWLLLERLAVITAEQGLVVLGGTLAVTLTAPAGLLNHLLNWIAPAAFFGGLAVFATITMQNAIASVALTFLSWWTFGFLGDGLIGANIPIWPLNAILPRLWLIHPFLQAQDCSTAHYALNRTILVALGLSLLVLTIRQMAHEERLLLGSATRQEGN